MPADPVAAGRKGGSRNTPAQQAARRKGQFRPVYHKPTEEQHAPETDSEPILVEVDEPKQ